MTDPFDARNDNDDQTTPQEEGELANPGPVPAEPEESSDAGGGPPGSLAPEAGPDRED